MESFNFMIRRATLCSGVTISALLFLSPSQSCEVQVVKYMENKQGEGMPLTEIYEEVSKELRVPLGNMSRWWRNKENRAGTFLMLMLHSALLRGHPPNIAVMVSGLQV